ncbi:MAG: EAL domain-containing protein [Pseudomonadota bacterium]
MSQGVLVIEQSATLSNLMVRTLSAGGYRLSSATRNFDRALELLRDSVTRNRPFDAVLLGVPPRQANPIKPVLKFLQNPGAPSQIPFILVIHDKHEILEKWADNRGHSAIVPWQRFSQVPGILGNMITQPQSASAAGESDLKGVNVLFVDDSQSARYAYRQLLETRGFPVDVASNVEEAVRKAAGTDYDLIIVDYYLPDGTGDELCRRIKALPNCENATLAIITGSYRESIIKDCLDAGAIECMFKNEAKELFVTRVASLAQGIETQKSVEAERQRLDGILGSVGDGVYGVTPAGEITFINPTGVQLLGYTQESELVGQRASEVLHRSETAGEDAASLDHSYRSGEALRGTETVFAHRRGHPLPVECTVFPLSIEQERRGAVVVFRDISERKSVEQLRWEVSHDPLTGLANRRHFSQHLDRQLERLHEEGGYDALLLVDIDRFGDLVESAGDAEGDRVLAEVAERLATRLRDRDLLARLEDDRFALLLSRIQLPTLFTIADEFRGVLSEVEADRFGVRRPVTGSIGVVILTRVTPSAEYALEHARIACEQAKKKGRNQTHIYLSEEDSRTARELESGWEDRFKDAIRNDRFVFLAQPIIPIDSGPALQLVDEDGNVREEKPTELIFELLLRMVSKDGQWVSPNVFVPLAERVNMVQEVDLWVIRNAAKKLEAFDKAEATDVCLTVNISNVTLQDPDALRLIRDVIESRRIDPRRLIFEVTETAEMASMHSARKFMLELKKLGCRFALDDFGTGFSSFSHLKHLPVDFIKIDGMFVQAMVNDDVDRTMVNSITSMAHALGLATIAEHVDSQDTLEAVCRAEVDFVQGHHFGEPQLLDTLDLETLIAQARPGDQQANVD